MNVIGWNAPWVKANNLPCSKYQTTHVINQILADFVMGLILRIALAPHTLLQEYEIQQHTCVRRRETAAIRMNDIMLGDTCNSCNTDDL
jgi:hypothetical protein